MFEGLQRLGMEGSLPRNLSQWLAMTRVRHGRVEGRKAEAAGPMQGFPYWTGMVSTGAEGTTPVSASEKKRSR